MKIMASTASSITLRRNSTKRSSFEISYTPRSVIVAAGSTTFSTTQDSTYRNETSATVDTVADIITTYKEPNLEGVLTNLNPEIALFDLDNGSFQSRVANGICRINLTVDGVARQVSVPIQRTASTTASVFTEFVAGTLPRHCADAIDTLLSGHNASTDKPYFSSGTTKNATCWASGLDLSPVSLGNPRVTVVSPLHAVGSEHYPNGGPYQFRGNDGVIYTRNSVGSLNLGPANSADGYNTDIYIVKFNSPLPASVVPVKVPPGGWQATYAPGVANRIPALMLDQEYKCLVGGVRTVSSFVTFGIPSNATRLAFNENIISGDSSNPAFLIVNNSLVLLCTWTFGGAGSGPNYEYQSALINAGMTTLGGGYQLTVADFSGFTAF